MKALKIIADELIWGVQEAFSSLPGFDVNLQVFEGTSISAEHVKDADILLTRSRTKANEALLKHSSVQFAATATIGDDHYDKAWLDQQGIAWATAAGSSTASVVEYVLAALVEMQRQGKVDLSTMTLGIIGVGRIGSLLAKVCQRLGVKVLLNDPPRQRQEPDGEFVSLEVLLSQADVISLHTPLILNGLDQTKHLLTQKELKLFKGKGVINAARGECLDNLALLPWLQGSNEAFSVLDCWEHEPHINQDLLAHSGCLIATPHIAGHSLDGKAANTQYIYDALCQYLDIQPIWDMQYALPVVTKSYDLSLQVSWDEWIDCLAQLYPIMHDHQALRSCLDVEGDERAAMFVQQRRLYPVRRAWSKQSDSLKQLFK